MLIVEYLHLLLTTPKGTPENWASFRKIGETGALLTDLVVAERITLSDDKHPRLELLSTFPTGHSVLDAALPLVAQRHGKRLDQVVTWGKLDPRDDVVASLVARGVLSLGERTFLGLGGPRTPEVNPEPEQEIRARLAAVLAGAAPADIAEATLLGILQGMGAAHAILRDESGGLRTGQLKKRISQVVEESPAGTAVTRAVQAITIAAATAAVAASGS